MNFRDLYLTEKENLKTMTANFRDVFPYSSVDLKVATSTEKDFGIALNCDAEVMSESGEPNHKVHFRFHKKNKEDPYNFESAVEVRCDCNAFRYNVAYPLLANKNLFGVQNGNFKIPNKVNNPKKIPTLCKHLYSYLKFLYGKGIVKQ